MNKQYQITGKTTSLKNYANVYDTIAAIERIVYENHKAVLDLSQQLLGNTEEETFHNIWNFVRKNIQYQNDQKGFEQLRTPQRTLHDKIGDCDDFSILISAILINLGYNHELVIAAYKQKDKWQHIYPTVCDKSGKRYVIDCVPEIPYFNYEAQPIKNRILIEMNKASGLNSTNNINNRQMKLEELGVISNSEMVNELREAFDINSLEGIANEREEILLLQGLLGNVAIVDEDDEYDTVISGFELKRNIIIRQLIDAKASLETELRNPTELSQLNDNKTELELINDIIDSFDDEEETSEALEFAISKDSLYINFYKAIQYGLSDLLEGLAGDEDDDIYYLKLMKEEGLFDEILEDEFDEEIEGLEGRKERLARRALRKDKGESHKRIGKKVRKGVSRFKKKHPRLAKFGHALTKYAPQTFAARRALEIFIRANAFRIADKIAIGYTSEGQARKLGYSKTEWLKFVEGKKKAERKWYAIGGKKDYLRKLVVKTKAGKRAGLRGVGLEAIGIAPAVVAAALKIFGSVIGFFKNLKLKKKDGTVIDDTASDYSNKSTKMTDSEINIDTMENENPNIDTHERSGVTTETVTGEDGNETTIYKDSEGNEIGKFKAFFLKNKTMIIIISIVFVVGIVGLIIWKVRERSLNGLSGAGLTKRQENYIKRQGLNNKAYAALVREEMGKDGKGDNKTNRKTYYKKVFKDAYNRPLSTKQTSAALNYNSMYNEVRQLAKQNGGGSQAWKDAWAEVKKKAEHK